VAQRGLAVDDKAHEMSAPPAQKGWWSAQFRQSGRNRSDDHNNHCSIKFQERPQNSGRGIPVLSREVRQLHDRFPSSEADKAVNLLSTALPQKFGPATFLAIAGPSHQIFRRWWLSSIL